MQRESVLTPISTDILREAALCWHTQAQAAEHASDLVTAALLYEEAYTAYRSAGALQEASSLMKHVTTLLYDISV